MEKNTPTAPTINSSCPLAATAYRLKLAPQPSCNQKRAGICRRLHLLGLGALLSTGSISQLLSPVFAETNEVRRMKIVLSAHQLQPNKDPLSVMPPSFFQMPLAQINVNVIPAGRFRALTELESFNVYIIDVRDPGLFQVSSNSDVYAYTRKARLYLL